MVHSAVQFAAKTSATAPPSADTNSNTSRSTGASLKNSNASFVARNSHKLRYQKSNLKRHRENVCETRMGSLSSPVALGLAMAPVFRPHSALQRGQQEGFGFGYHPGRSEAIGELGGQPLAISASRYKAESDSHVSPPQSEWQLGQEYPPRNDATELDRPLDTRWLMRFGSAALLRVLPSLALPRAVFPRPSHL